jgi:hypothetical protein
MHSFNIFSNLRDKLFEKKTKNILTNNYSYLKMVYSMLKYGKHIIYPFLYYFSKGDNKK